MNFFEYSKARNKAPVAGKVRIKVGVSPLYRARIPSDWIMRRAVRSMGSEDPDTFWEKSQRLHKQRPKGLYFREFIPPPVGDFWWRQLGKWWSKELFQRSHPRRWSSKDRFHPWIVLGNYVFGMIFGKKGMHSLMRYHKVQPHSYEEKPQSRLFCGQKINVHDGNHKFFRAE